MEERYVRIVSERNTWGFFNGRRGVILWGCEGKYEKKVTHKKFSNMNGISMKIVSKFS